MQRGTVKCIVRGDGRVHSPAGGREREKAREQNMEDYIGYLSELIPEKDSLKNSRQERQLPGKTAVRKSNCQKRQLLRKVQYRKDTGN